MQRFIEVSLKNIGKQVIYMILIDFDNWLITHINTGIVSLTHTVEIWNILLFKINDG